MGEFSLGPDAPTIWVALGVEDAGGQAQGGVDVGLLE